MDNSKRGIVPIVPCTIICKFDSPSTKDNIKRMSRIPYDSAVGSIMYVMTYTRSDVAYVNSLASSYQSNPR